MLEDVDVDDITEMNEACEIDVDCAEQEENVSKRAWLVHRW